MGKGRGMQGPGISVVVNTYNRAHRIPATLEGLSRQAYANFEVVVVNGPSTDNTREVLREYGNGIRIAHCPVAELGRSRNIGIDMAAGEIVAFIDDDAVPRDAWLDRLVSRYDAPNVAGVGGYVFDGLHDCMQWKICTSSRLGDGDIDASPPIEKYLGQGADPFLYLPGCNMSFRRSVLVEVGGFDERYAYGYEDPDICCRIIDAGYRLALQDDAIVDHYPAANHARDAAGHAHDAYNWLRSRMIFAFQHGRGRYSEAQIAAAAQRYAEHYRNTGRSLLERGVIRGEEWQIYLDRIECGMREGMAAAAEERFSRPFEGDCAHSFRPYPRPAW